MARLKDWAQLVRVPNTLTASADALAGFSLAAGVWSAFHAPALVVIALASIALYWAGMVLNDVNDIEKDRREERNGPLTDGRIAWSTANRFGWSLIFGGVLLAVVAGYLAELSRSSTTPRDTPLESIASVEHLQASSSLQSEPLQSEPTLLEGAAGLTAPPKSISETNERNLLWLAPGLVAIALALCVVAYDSPLKQTFLASWIMGLCRAVNLSMGIALGVVASASPDEAFARMGNAMYLIPMGHGLFVVGLTLAARKEAMLKQSGWHLICGWGVSLMGGALIAMSAIQAGPLANLYLTPEQGFPMLISLLVLPWLNRAVHSVHFKTIPTLVRAIKQAIVTILFLDAGIALQFAGATAGIIVCSLIIPTILLGRWFRMT